MGREKLIILAKDVYNPYYIADKAAWRLAYRSQVTICGVHQAWENLLVAKKETKYAA